MSDKVCAPFPWYKVELSLSSKQTVATKQHVIIQHAVSNRADEMMEAIRKELMSYQSSFSTPFYMAISIIVNACVEATQTPWKSLIALKQRLVPPLILNYSQWTRLFIKCPEFNETILEYLQIQVPDEQNINNTTAEMDVIITHLWKTKQASWICKLPRSLQSFMKYSATGQEMLVDPRLPQDVFDWIITATDFLSSNRLIIARFIKLPADRQEAIIKQCNANGDLLQRLFLHSIEGARLVVNTYGYLPDLQILKIVLGQNDQTSVFQEYLSFTYDKEKDIDASVLATIAYHPVLIPKTVDRFHPQRIPYCLYDSIVNHILDYPVNSVWNVVTKLQLDAWIFSYPCTMTPSTTICLLVKDDVQYMLQQDGFVPGMADLVLSYMGPGLSVQTLDNVPLVNSAIVVDSIVKSTFDDKYPDFYRLLKTIHRTPLLLSNIKKRKFIQIE